MARTDTGTGAGGAGEGTLWIVATPIGTVDDLSPRAGRVLAEADLILSEDTRRTRALLGRLAIRPRGRLRSLHEHNERQVVARAVRAIEAGDSVALVSDAGTPVLSDPGFLLVREARRHRLRVLSVPGPSSFSAALAAAGQPPLPATLVGFLPPRTGSRRRRIAELAALPGTLVVLVSPHRLAAELADLAAGLGADRHATLLAEISKLHERAESATLDEIAAGVEAGEPRGEYVLVIGPPCEQATSPPSDDTVRQLFAASLAAGFERKEAVRRTADELGLPRREVYRVVFVNGDRG
jgi:16S rRNA (cytidine1402-2'-O)-methyltransferase